jgi:multicomponent Na+:H+ antiporter subunit D
MSASLVVLPILLPIIAAPLLFIFNGRAAFQRAIALFTAVIVAAVAVWLLLETRSAGVLTHAVGGWKSPFGLMIAADLLGAVFVTLTSLLSVLIVVYSFKTIPERGQGHSYYPLLMLLLASINGLSLTGDIFNFYVFLEIMVLSSFTLVAFEGKRKELEASFKYAILNLLASTLLLVSVVGIYGVAGTLNMADLARKFAGQEIPELVPIVMLFVAAFGIKAALFPFHFWLPDAHSMAPTPVSAMLSGIIVKMGVYGLIRFFYTILGGLELGEVIMWLAAVSLVFGMICAVSQKDIKRMLAYSTISQVGYILIVFSLGSAAGLTAAIVYTANHMVIKAGLFMLAGIIIKQTGTKRMDEMGGLLGRMPVTAVLFLIGSLALAGVPPLNGFISKLATVVAILDNGKPLLLVPVVIGTMLTLVVMTKAWAQIFLGESRRKAVESDWLTLAPVVALTVAIFALGVLAQPVMTMAAETATQLLDPEVYAVSVLGGIKL